MVEGAGGNMIEIKPVKKAKAAKYPTRLKLLEDPSLLERRMPLSWSSNAKLVGIAAFLIAANRCFEASAGDEKAKKPAIVAPIFEHGKGEGGSLAVKRGESCDPEQSFLPEEEALSLIADELSKAGVSPVKKAVALSGVKISPSSYSDAKPDPCEVPASLFEERRGIAVEYISSGNYLKLGGPLGRTYETKEAAKSLAEASAKNGAGFKLGVFYDPVTSWSMASRPKFPSVDGLDDSARKALVDKWVSEDKAWRERAEKKAIEESREMLRLQVKDFVEWLKAQGAI